MIDCAPFASIAKVLLEQPVYGSHEQRSSQGLNSESGQSRAQQSGCHLAPGIPPMTTSLEAFRMSFLLSSSCQ